MALTCAGHELDVVHVDWAADDSLLASARLVMVYVLVQLLVVWALWLWEPDNP